MKTNNKLKFTKSIISNLKSIKGGTEDTSRSAEDTVRINSDTSRIEDDTVRNTPINTNDSLTKDSVKVESTDSLR